MLLTTPGSCDERFPTGGQTGKWYSPDLVNALQTKARLVNDQNESNEETFSLFCLVDINKFSVSFDSQGIF